MIRICSLFTFVLLSMTANAQTQTGGSSYTIRDVTAEYAKKAPEKLYGGDFGGGPVLIPTPKPGSSDPTDPTIPNTGSKIDINQIIAIGGKIWDFVVSNKPNADITPLKASIVPAGITSFTQLVWNKNKIASKIYRIEFKNIFGNPAGAFDYRITYMYGGTYQGKGKFLGQISVYPFNANLRTDRSVTFKAELASALNFGTEDEPVAGGQIVLSWSSPTTTRFEVKSVEYMIYGDGEIQDLTNGL